MEQLKAPSPSIPSMASVRGTGTLAQTTGPVSSSVAGRQEARKAKRRRKRRGKKEFSFGDVLSRAAKIGIGAAKGAVMGGPRGAILGGLKGATEARRFRSLRGRKETSANLPPHSAGRILGANIESRDEALVKPFQTVFSVIGSTAATFQGCGVWPQDPWFPDLHSGAAGYSYYRFRSIKIRFISNKTDTITGQLGICYSADPLVTPSGDEIDFMTFDPAVLGPAKENLSYALPQTEWLNCRYTSNTDSTYNQRTCIAGRLALFTTGQADSTSSVGFLIVEGVCEFRDVVAPDQVTTFGSEKVTGGGTVSKTAIFGTVPVYADGQLWTASSSTLSFKRPGQYLVFIVLTGTGMENGSAAVTGTATSVLLDSGTNLAAAATEAWALYSVRGNGTAAVAKTVIFDWSGASTVTAAVVRVCGYDVAFA